MLQITQMHLELYFLILKKDVYKRQDIYGLNIDDKKIETTLYRFFRSFNNLFSMILLVLILVSFFTDVIFTSNYRRNATTFLMLVIIFLISGFVRFIQEMRSKKAVDSLIELINTNVQTRRNGKWQEISSNELVVGDRVKFYAGDRIPADIRLIKSNELFISQSMLTGESIVIEKNKMCIRDRLRADIDALSINEETDFEFKSKVPGVMHACGHDGHTASLLGVAMMLNEMKDELHGDVKLIFQPAEEVEGGALPMIKEGVLENVDAVFGGHLWGAIKEGKIGVRHGALMASPDIFLSLIHI